MVGGGGTGKIGKAAQVKMVRSLLNGQIPEEYSAIRVGKYKLILGQAGRSDWYGFSRTPCPPLQSGSLPKPLRSQTGSQ